MKSSALNVFSEHAPDADDPFVQALGKSFALDSQGRLREGSIYGDGRMLIALSGGPDSMALLVALNALSARFGLSISAFHINHGLRGDESDEDERFCAGVCGQLRVPFDSIRLTEKSKDESTLRKARYEALLSCAHTSGIDVICTGHTVDDQVETILFRLFRGSSPTGLCGIPEYRDAALASSVRIFRPMLNMRRAAVLDFLERNSVPFRQDSSNAEIFYARNYIREILVPSILDRFPAAVDKIEVFRQLVAADEEVLALLTNRLLLTLQGADYIRSGNSTEEKRPESRARTEETSDWQEKWSIQILSAQPLSLRRRAVAHAMTLRGLHPSFEMVERILALCQSESGRVSLSDIWEVAVRENSLHWQLRQAECKLQAMDALYVPVLVPGSTTLIALGVNLSIEDYQSGDDMKVNFPSPQDYEALVDLSRVPGPLYLRLRRPGDIIHPFGMPTTIRLKKYLHTHKKHQGELTAQVVKGLKTVVLANDDEVLWVPGIGLSEKLRVRGQPSHLVRFRRPE